MAESEDAIVMATREGIGSIGGGDAILKRMIQRDSGVDFSTLRLVDGGDCIMVVLFSKADAITWLLSSGSEHSESAATQYLTSWQAVEKACGEGAFLSVPRITMNNQE